MSQDMNSDPRKSKVAKWYKIGIVAAVCLLVSPIIFMVIKGAIGLLIAVGLGLIAVQLAPWFSIKLATWSLKLIKQDAQDNPVETRQQIEQETQRSLDKFKEDITLFQSNFATFKDQVASIVKKYPEKTQQYKDQVAKLEQLLLVRSTNWRAAREDLNTYKDETIEISDLWDMANSAVVMNKMAGTMGNDPMKELRTRVANTSVHNRMNLAMAQLSTSLMEESSTPMLTLVQPNILQLSNVKEAEYVQVNR